MEYEKESSTEVTINSDTEYQFIEVEFQKELTRIANEIKMDKDKITTHESFEKGFRNGLYYSGFYTALINSGLSNTQAFELIRDRMAGSRSSMVTV